MPQHKYFDQISNLDFTHQNRDCITTFLQVPGETQHLNHWLFSMVFGPFVTYLYVINTNNCGGHKELSFLLWLTFVSGTWMGKQGLQKLHLMSMLQWKLIFAICGVEEEAGKQGCTCLHKLVTRLLHIVCLTMTGISCAAPWRLSRYS